MNNKMWAALQVKRGAVWIQHKYITLAEAERQRKAGRYTRHRAPSQQMKVYRETPDPAYSTSHETPGAIVAGEMLANVKLAGSRHTIRAARLKIRNYPLVRQHDPNFQGA